MNREAGKSRRSSKKPKPQPLKSPTSEELRELTIDFELASGPATVLEFVIKNTLADLRIYQGARSGGREAGRTFIPSPALAKR